jgi:oligopeptide/dipeptide ABC transporter ATP-binding protein
MASPKRRAETAPAHRPSADAGTDLLVIEGLDVVYGGGGGGGVFGLSPRTGFRAVAGVDLALRRGESVAIVGESGSGKTSLLQALVGLAPVAAGRVRLGDVELTRLRGRDVRRARRDMQFVFQDPYSSLDPSMRIGQLLDEPLRVHLRSWSRAQREERVREVIESVGLATSVLGRYPNEFSGGQRQRIAIARALTVEPKVLLLDEPVSALDGSTQGQVLNLLHDIQQRTGVAYLMVAHDLPLVRLFADRIAVMYQGRVVESGPAAALMAAPRHPYTRSLLDASPLPNPTVQRARPRVTLPDETSDAPTPPCCAFAPRCPERFDRCDAEAPAAYPVGPDRLARCFLHAEGTDALEASDAPHA